MGQSMRNSAFLADWESKDKLPICLSCHAPFQRQQPDVVTGVRMALPFLVFASTPNVDFDVAFQGEGVTCMACHYTPDESIGATHAVDAPHATSVIPSLRTGEVCERCHQMVRSPLHAVARPLIDTVAEHRRWQERTGRLDTCVDCHMTPVTRPSVAGRPAREARRHDFHGGWHAETLRSAVSLGALRVDGTNLSVEVANLAGHGFPTGETSVVVEVVFVVYGPHGEALGDAVKRITRVVKGPPFRDVIDTTLQPGETRRVEVVLPEEIMGRAVRATASIRMERYGNERHVQASAWTAGLVTSVEIAAVEAHW